MPILPVAIHRVNEIPIKTPTPFFTDLVIIFLNNVEVQKSPEKKKPETVEKFWKSHKHWPQEQVLFQQFIQVWENSTDLNEYEYTSVTC